MKKIFFIILLSIVILINPKTIKGVSCSAKSYILYDMDRKEVILEKNSNKKMLTASIAKILTAIVAIEEEDLNKEVIISKEDLLEEGSKSYILEGEKVRLIDLLYGLMLRSGNDSAHAIANAVSSSTDEFVKKMNEYAYKIGMKNSIFYNPSGLDEKNENISTSLDMALLMTYCFNNEKFREINNTIIYNFKSDKSNYSFRNKHRLINRNSIYNGGKTGYTKKAGRTLVTTASYKNLNLCVVTFQDPNDFLDHINLFDYGFKQYKEEIIMKKQVLKQELYENKYLGYLKKDIVIYLKYEDELEDYFIVIYYYPEINKEKIIGEVRVYYKNKKVFSENIYLYDPLSDDNEAFYDLMWRYFYD